MRSIDAIVDEWKTKLLADAIPTDAPGKRAKPSMDDSETDEESKSEGDEIEDALEEGEMYQIRDERRAQNANVRAVYDSVNSQEDAKNRAADDLIYTARTVFGFAASNQFEYMIRHISMSASEPLGQWAIALELLGGERVTPTSRLPFPETDSNQEQTRFETHVPLADQVSDFLMDAGALSEKVELPMAAQDPDADWIRGLADDVAGEDDDDLFADMPPPSPQTGGGEDDEDDEDGENARPTLSPENTLTHEALIRGVCGLLRSGVVNRTAVLDLRVADELSDGRHSIHAHSPDFYIEPSPGGGLQLPARVSVYYRSSTTDGGVSPLTATGSLMAGFRTLILVALKMHVQANHADSPAAALSALRRDPTLDVRHGQLAELCTQIHDMMGRDDVLDAMNVADGVARRAAYRNLHALLNRRDAPSKEDNGVLHKLRLLRELPTELAGFLSTDAYAGESPLVSLLVRTCVFACECLLSRLLCRSDVPFHGGMQSIALPVFPSLRLNELLDEAQAAAAAGGASSPSSPPPSPVYSVVDSPPSPASRAADSQETIVDSPPGV